MNLQRAWTESIAGSRQADRRAEISYRTGQILHMLYHTTCHSLLLGRENVREKLVCLFFFRKLRTCFCFNSEAGSKKVLKQVF